MRHTAAPRIVAMCVVEHADCYCKVAVFMQAQFSFVPHTEVHT